MSRFSGRSICITGAGSGLGRALALRVAEEGASVFGLDLNGEGLEETTELVRAIGGRMGSRRCDVTDRADWDAPRGPAEGFAWVLINGVPALERGRPVAGLPGRVLRAN